MHSNTMRCMQRGASSLIFHEKETFLPLAAAAARKPQRNRMRWLFTPKHSHPAKKKYTERLGFKSRVVKVKKYCGNNSQKERGCAYEAPTSLFQGKNRPNSLRKNLLKFASRARRLKIRQNTARQKLFLPSFFGVVTCMK